ncbi:hypothetical protein C464_02873 [Halorubrum coriense DSM 10284]|uniref:DUF8048 domain-containing protein n=1 Tax=Halorubrum coriense DSM 10284 TaxID=1227466 RepID=M0ESX1_9EURY|nr:hypothetical protein [Halorubrum coriense]ELZ50203.1 hypothetical protein C464_02873 [Halorubrum coriense DSM 10284]
MSGDGATGGSGDGSNGGTTGGSEDGSDDDRDVGSYPIGGTALVKATALASVPAARLPTLLARVQADLGPRIEAYRRRYERVTAESDREAFLVEPDHWEEVADRIGLSDRERDAVVRAHEATVERIGSGCGRREEFETALEIRSCVVIGVGEDTDEGEDAGEGEAD